jgi:hypothetical protein
VSPVKYELGFMSQKTTFFIVTAVKALNLMKLLQILLQTLPSISLYVAVYIRMQDVSRTFTKSPHDAILSLHAVFKSVEENIWTEEGCSDGRVEKTA